MVFLQGVNIASLPRRLRALYYCYGGNVRLSVCPLTELAIDHK